MVKGHRIIKQNAFLINLINWGMINPSVSKKSFQIPKR